MGQAAIDTTDGFFFKRQAPTTQFLEPSPATQQRRKRL